MARWSADTDRGRATRSRIRGARRVAAGTTFLRNISQPTLTVFTPSDAPNGVGVIVVPGGGWTINAWTHEGLDVARWLSALGYTAFVLKYRVLGSGADQGAFEARRAAGDATLADSLRLEGCRAGSVT